MCVLTRVSCVVLARRSVLVGHLSASPHPNEGA
jgi:hypothetical protein